jgi:hypothetical protein
MLQPKASLAFLASLPGSADLPDSVAGRDARPDRSDRRSVMAARCFDAPLDVDRWLYRVLAK